MVLNRLALESKLLQQLLAHPDLDLKIWSDQELQLSIQNTLRQKSSKELWIFAYGSLIWNPIFNYCDRRIATVEGWQRKFCLLAPVGRGTIDNPGLVLGLEAKAGASCQGVAYRLQIDENMMSELLLLWRREMVVGSYIPTWISSKSKKSHLSTAKGLATEILTFTVNPQHPTYVKNLPVEKMVESLATAKGSIGSSAEYLGKTVQGLLAAGIEDQALIELDHLVKKRQQQIS